VPLIRFNSGSGAAANGMLPGYHFFAKAVQFPGEVRNNFVRNDQEDFWLLFNGFCACIWNTPVPQQSESAFLSPIIILKNINTEHYVVLRYNGNAHFNLTEVHIIMNSILSMSAYRD